MSDNLGIFTVPFSPFDYKSSPVDFRFVNSKILTILVSFFPFFRGLRKSVWFNTGGNSTEKKGFWFFALLSRISMARVRRFPSSSRWICKVESKMLKFAQDIFFNSKDYLFLSRVVPSIIYFFLFQRFVERSEINEIEDFSKRRRDVFFKIAICGK